MDANLEIMRMKKEIIESINQHQMPVVVTVLVLKEILSEAQSQLNDVLEKGIAKEKEEERKKNEERREKELEEIRESEERKEYLAAICRDSKYHTSYSEQTPFYRKKEELVVESSESREQCEKIYPDSTETECSSNNAEPSEATA